MRPGSIASLLIQPLQYKKPEKHLRHAAGVAIKQYSMIEDGDKVMGCLSAGKDSYAILALLMSVHKKTPTVGGWGPRSLLGGESRAIAVP